VVADTGTAETVLVVATAHDTSESRLRAGEAASAVLLEATAAGLAACPLTQPLEHPATRQLARETLLDGTLWPHLVIRTGWPAAGAPPLPATPRRDLDDVLTPRS
jgi:nitroreductase